jgi:hypothetical protein
MSLQSLGLGMDYMIHRCPESGEENARSVKFCIPIGALLFDQYTSDFRYRINFCPYCGKAREEISKEDGEVVREL